MKSVIFTLILAFASFWTVSANVVTSPNEVGEDGWKKGYYYYLEVDDSFLSLDETKTDSVIMKKFNGTPTKAMLDYALWEISFESTPGDPLFTFKNKRTQAVLSFVASEIAELNLVSGGIDTWTFKDGKIQANYDGGKKTMALVVDNGELKLAASTTTSFKVYAPDTKFVLTASQLGDGFQIFQLSFDKTYEGNLFEGKDLLAKDLADGYVTLQEQGNETFDDGVAKFFTVDTLKTTITGATDVYGAKFALDSTRSIIRPNEEWQKFRFLIDLRNDSLNICVAAAPDVNGDLSSVANVKVVYVGLDDKNVLTVAKYNENGLVAQGELPSITIKRGNPGSIATGTGVYFLKSASKGETGGKYIVKYDNGIVTTSHTPSILQPEGQWYIKEAGGMYSVVDRNTNTAVLLMGEIFPVQGMANTFTFGHATDSITVEYQKDVVMQNLFLGSRLFTKEEIANNGYVLNLLSAAGVSNLYTISKDSILQIKSGSLTEAITFKVEVVADSVKNVDTGIGALALGDTLYHAVYKLKELFTNRYAAYDTEKKIMKLSAVAAANEFVFAATSKADEYVLQTAGKNVTMNATTSDLVLSDDINNFSFIEVEAPEYASFATGHKRLSSDAKSLTMNTLNFLAEMKMEGQDITKAVYEKDNFSLWIEEAPSSTPEKQLYYIAKGISGASSVQMYYLASLRDSAEFDTQGNALIGFITSDTIKTMDNSPALFAFKTTENGGFILESQKELGDNTGKQYIGFVNNRLVMSSNGIEFDMENASAPIANEITVDTKVRAVGETGSVTIYHAGGKKISIINILGQVMSIKRASSDCFTMPAGRGVVFVAIEGEPTQKVLIK